MPENKLLKEMLSTSRYRGLEHENNLFRSSDRSPTKRGLIKGTIGHGEGDYEGIKSGGYIGDLDFISVKKINTNSIDFTCRNIISSDDHKSLAQYVIDFAKLISNSAGSRFVEIAFFDQEVIDLFCFIHPKLEKKIEPLSKFDHMICFRSDPMFESRETSFVHSLHVALSDFYKKNSINYRHNTFFIPVQYDWMQKGCRLIGSVLILDPTRSIETILQSTEKEKIDVKTAKMVVSARSTKAINSFANSLVCELKARFSEKEFNSLLELSSLMLCRQENIA